MITGIVIVVGIIAVIVIFLIFFSLTYTVVNPNEAHVVVVMNGGRKIYSPSIQDGNKQNTAYFYIPFLMRRNILPLANVKMEIPKFDLKDQKVAPFICEVTCWFRVRSPDIAMEKLDIRDGDFEGAVRSTLEELVRGIARASAMKQEILQIMSDRKTFGDVVQTEVNGSLKEWGLELVQLEIIDIYDDEGSTVIQDYEKMREATIRSTSRQMIASQNQQAEVAEANSQQVSGIARAKAEQEVQKTIVEKEKNIEITRQEAAKLIAAKRQEANKQSVEAERTLQVGNAQVIKQALIEEADGKAQSVYKQGKAEADVVEAKGNAAANVVKNTGIAEAEVIKEKGLAKAVSIDKEADALKKYNDAGITIETIRATVEVEKVKYQSIGEALKTANLNIVQGGVQDLFGFKVGPEQGAGIAQMVQAFAKTAGFENISSLAKGLAKKTDGTNKDSKKA